MTDELNISALQLEVASYQDYSSGQAQNTTQLQLGLSQEFFNDKLEVTVSGMVNVEGETQRQLSDYVGDLILEYKITDDGRLRLKGFRKNDFNAIDGQIIETGAGILYIRDYNTFKELFKSADEK